MLDPCIASELTVKSSDSPFIQALIKQLEKMPETIETVHIINVRSGLPSVSIKVVFDIDIPGPKYILAYEAAKSDFKRRLEFDGILQMTENTPYHGHFRVIYKL